MHLIENTLSAVDPKREQHVLLRRLGRNHKDIRQFLGKLTSYLGEPRTHHQFLRFNRLRETAQELERSNQEIGWDLRDRSSNDLIAGRFERHLERCRDFAKEVVDYLGEVKAGKGA